MRVTAPAGVSADRIAKPVADLAPVFEGVKDASMVVESAPRPRTKLSNERKTIIALGVLAVVMLSSVFELAHLTDANTETNTRSSSRSTAITTTPARASTTTTDPPMTYQVQRGDTLTSIAQRFGVTPAVIIATNQLTDPDHLREGQPLAVPSPPPIQLAVVPATVTSGGSVKITLTGAKSAEGVTFEIDNPNGPFAGPPHTAASDGTVTATYQPGIEDPAGLYTITAHGDQGTSAQGSFRVDATSP